VRSVDLRVIGSVSALVAASYGTPRPACAPLAWGLALFAISMGSLRSGSALTCSVDSALVPGSAGPPAHARRGYLFGYSALMRIRAMSTSRLGGPDYLGKAPASRADRHPMSDLFLNHAHMISNRSSECRCSIKCQSGLKRLRRRLAVSTVNCRNALELKCLDHEWTNAAETVSLGSLWRRLLLTCRCCDLR